jgi:hypothetical protein
VAAELEVKEGEDADTFTIDVGVSNPPGTVDLGDDANRLRWPRLGGGTAKGCRGFAAKAERAALKISC